MMTTSTNPNLMAGFCENKADWNEYIDHCNRFSTVRQHGTPDRYPCVVFSKWSTATIGGNYVLLHEFMYGDDPVFVAVANFG